MPPVPTAGERARRARKTTTSAQATNGAARLTDAQLEKLVNALEAARDGDFSVRLRSEGPLADVAAAFNELVERNQQVTKELIRVSKVVGREGRINDRASVAGAPGSWSEKVGAVNELIDNLAWPTIEVARVIDAVADGAGARRVETATTLIVNATSLGGVQSTIETRHRWEGDRVPEGLLRLSVGLEPADQLWFDLARALEQA